MKEILKEGLLNQVSVIKSKLVTKEKVITHQGKKPSQATYKITNVGREMMLHKYYELEGKTKI